MKRIKTTLVISTLIFSASGMAIDKTAAGAVAGAAIEYSMMTQWYNS
jgi:hypothetical protein